MTDPQEPSPADADDVERHPCPRVTRQHFDIHLNDGPPPAARSSDAGRPPRVHPVLAPPFLGMDGARPQSVRPARTSAEGCDRSCADGAGETGGRRCAAAGPAVRGGSWPETCGQRAGGAGARECGTRRREFRQPPRVGSLNRAGSACAFEPAAAGRPPGRSAPVRDDARGHAMPVAARWTRGRRAAARQRLRQRACRPVSWRPACGESRESSSRARAGARVRPGRGHGGSRPGG